MTLPRAHSSRIAGSRNFDLSGIRTPTESSIVTGSPQRNSFTYASGTRPHWQAPRGKAHLPLPIRPITQSEVINPQKSSRNAPGNGALYSVAGHSRAQLPLPPKLFHPLRRTFCLASLRLLHDLPTESKAAWNPGNPTESSNIN